VTLLDSTEVDGRLTSFAQRGGPPRVDSETPELDEKREVEYALPLLVSKQ
jgi:hypothetical protein